MSIVIEATFEDGVFKPLQRVDIPEHDRVRLVIEAVADAKAQRRRQRVTIDPDVARAIAEDPEFSLWG